MSHVGTASGTTWFAPAVSVAAHLLTTASAKTAVTAPFAPLANAEARGIRLSRRAPATIASWSSDGKSSWSLLVVATERSVRVSNLSTRHVFAASEEASEANL
jgi:hypothetical protein